MSDARNEDDVRNFMIGESKSLRQFMWLAVNYKVMPCILNYEGKPIKNICLN